jgi:hypothetical protein
MALRSRPISAAEAMLADELGEERFAAVLKLLLGSFIVISLTEHGNWGIDSMLYCGAILSIDRGPSECPRMPPRRSL